MVSNIGYIILRRSVDLGSSMRGRRSSSSLNDEVIRVMKNTFVRNNNDGMSRALYDYSEKKQMLSISVHC